MTRSEMISEIILNYRESCMSLIEHYLYVGFEGFCNYTNEELEDEYEQAYGESIKIIEL